MRVFRHLHAAGHSLGETHGLYVESAQPLVIMNVVGATRKSPISFFLKFTLSESDWRGAHCNLRNYLLSLLLLFVQNNKVNEILEYENNYNNGK